MSVRLARLLNARPAPDPEWFATPLKCAAEMLSKRKKEIEPSKEQIETFKSQIPFKWPGGEQYFKNAETSTQVPLRASAAWQRALQCGPRALMPSRSLPWRLVW